MKLPSYLIEWFSKKGWVIHSYQQEMFDFFSKQKSVLLVAPTGGGKTLASFLPSIIDIHENKVKGLHTLYISPLKALTEDVRRNLINPIKELALSVQTDIRTGDTSSYRRQKQLKQPPNILLTTPESLMLLLSYPKARQFFANLKTIIIDEIHSLVPNKRGDLTSLGLAQLTAFAPKAIRIGLSATISNPQLMAKWLMPKRKKAEIIIAKIVVKPRVQLLAAETVPYSGFMAKHAVPAIYEVIKEHKLSLIFVNTRAQAEFLFYQLWLANQQKLNIAIYHGSLSKEQRFKTEQLIINGGIQTLICTSALELGIDWGDVSAVIQVGAPYGVSRLLQRIGRSNHRLNEPSLAYLVPTNCFNALESEAAIRAINAMQLENEEMHPGSLDVVIQFIVNAACSEPVREKELFNIVSSAYPYQSIEPELFSKLFQFATNGGYTLQYYEQYHRLIETEKCYFIPASAKVIRRHRQNIGTIIEAARLRVKVINKRKDRIVGDIEEGFAQELEPGDSFLFAGEILEFVRLHDLTVETRKINGKDPRLPSYVGGMLPLSTFLANEVAALINQPHSWLKMPTKIQKWLDLQQRFSLIPSAESLLVEQFQDKKTNYLVIYSFAGRRANQSLGMLITKRLEALKLKPLSFTATDYGLAISNLKIVSEEEIYSLFSISVLYEALEKWFEETFLLKRKFREIAIISGLTERQIAGTRKSMKQVTFSTDLIYDVLKKHEPEHILLEITKRDALKTLLDVDRLVDLLKQFDSKIIIKELTHSSPFAIPILSTFKTEKITGQGEEELLSLAEVEAKASQLMEEVTQIVNQFE